MRKNNRKGFTIVELIIVIAVIAILAGVLIPTFSGVVTKAKENAALQEVKNAYTAALAEDLSTADITDDTVYNKGVIIVEYDDILVQIDEDGTASVLKTGSATWTLSDAGVFAKISG